MISSALGIAVGNIRFGAIVEVHAAPYGSRSSSRDATCKILQKDEKQEGRKATSVLYKRLWGSSVGCAVMEIGRGAFSCFLF